MNAKDMYETYCNDSDWKNYQGNQCPPWDKLTIGVQQHWEAVADAVADTAGGTLVRFINDRLQAMRGSALAWAHSREAYAAQLAMLLDIASLGTDVADTKVRAHELMYQIFCEGPSGHIELGATIDDSDECREWCAAAIEATKKALDAL